MDYNHFEIIIKSQEQYDKVLVKFKELGIITGDYSKNMNFIDALMTLIIFIKLIGDLKEVILI